MSSDKKVVRTFYRKHWTGYTSGTPAGRDDGYPEPRRTEYATAEAMAEDFGKCDNERYEVVQEAVTPLDADTLKPIIIAGQESLRVTRMQAERQRDLENFERLRQKLGL